MTKTILNKWHDVVNEGDLYPTYTRDSWEIPAEGAEVWCTAWDGKRTIKPYGDGCHVYVGNNVYHNDELMGIIERPTANGHTWGIEGVTMTREQRINGYWKKVNFPNA